MTRPRFFTKETGAPLQTFAMRAEDTDESQRTNHRIGSLGGAESRRRATQMRRTIVPFLATG
jgi:hypothetical protein